MAKTNFIGSRFRREFPITYWLFIMVTIIADGIFFLRFRKACSHFSTFSPCLINRFYSGSTKVFLFKTKAQIISDQFILLDNNYISIYEHIYVTEINGFTRVFHKTSNDRGFLVIKLFEIFYLLCYPFFTTITDRSKKLPRWFLKADKTSKVWKAGLNTDGGKKFFHHLFQFYTLNFGKLFTHRDFY